MKIDKFILTTIVVCIVIVLISLATTLVSSKPKINKYWFEGVIKCVQRLDESEL